MESFFTAIGMIIILHLFILVVFILDELLGGQGHGLLLIVVLYIIWVRINLNRSDKKTPE